MMQLAQRALQVLNLALIVNLLPLGQLQSLQNLFHLVERVLQFFNDPIDLIDGVRDAGGLWLFGDRGLRLVPMFSLLDSGLR